MNKFIITEEEKNRILGLHKERSKNHYLTESTLSAEALNGMKLLSIELGEPIDEEMVMDASACSIDDIQIDSNTKPEVLELFTNVKEKIKELISNGDKDSLKSALKELKSKLKENKMEGGETNEQVGVLTGAFTLLGISAPLWAWVAVGALVLILLIWAIVKLISWLPKTSGSGCTKRKTYRVRVR
jgi:hypothetical protein